MLLLAVLGLLVGGLARGSAALQWGSFAASAVAALVPAVGGLRQRLARAYGGASAEAPADQQVDEAAALDRGSEPAELGTRSGAPVDSGLAAAAHPAAQLPAVAEGFPAPTRPEPPRTPAASRGWRGSRSATCCWCWT